MLTRLPSVNCATHVNPLLGCCCYSVQLEKLPIMMCGLTAALCVLQAEVDALKVTVQNLQEELAKARPCSDRLKGTQLQETHQLVCQMLLLVLVSMVHLLAAFYHVSCTDM